MLRPREKSYEKNKHTSHICTHMWSPQQFVTPARNYVTVLILKQKAKKKRLTKLSHSTCDGMTRQEQPLNISLNLVCCICGRFFFAREIRRNKKHFTLRPEQDEGYLQPGVVHFAGYGQTAKNVNLVTYFKLATQNKFISLM